MASSKGKRERERKQAEREAQAAELSTSFEAHCRDPQHPLYDDPVWNPLHRLAPRVTELIERGGLLGADAVRRARWEESAQIIASGVRDSSLPSG